MAQVDGSGIAIGPALNEARAADIVDSGWKRGAQPDSSHGMPSDC